MDAPPKMLANEKRLMGMADLIFTGASLYEAKRGMHPDVHAFPSSVDREHFARARDIAPNPEDQGQLPRPRLGFHGVIDERMDLVLLEEIAKLRPNYQFILIGPVVKIDPAALPRLPNIHYLGRKSYDDLPVHLAGWDAAIMPFALNEATKYISPTKTPEYLAGGRAVISTPVTDVARGYGNCPAVWISSEAQEFVESIDAALEMPRADVERHADAALLDMSWDRTWEAMHHLMQQALSFSASGTSSKECAATTARKQHYDVLIVGAGFGGSVMAERLAAGAGKRVLVADRRPHIGGNAFDYYDEAGILVHKYGPHIFHTNSQLVFEYLSRFTEWRPYEHRVLAHVDDQLVPIPINLTTLEMLYGRSFSEEEAAAFLEQRAEPVETVKTAEDVVLSTVGRELYEKFFRGYTQTMGSGPFRLG